MVPFLFKKLESSDAPFLQALRIETDRDSPGPLGSESQRREAILLKQAEHDLALESGATFGAWSQNTLVGVASIAPTLAQNSWFGLYGIAVTKAYRGQKVAHHLVACCISFAKERNAEGVTLDVNLPNPAALKLYQSFGFEEWNKSSKAYVHAGVHYDQLSMRKLFPQSPTSGFHAKL